MSPRTLGSSPRALRLRLTLAFASVVAGVLATAALLIYVQFRDSLATRVDRELVERQALFISFTEGRSLRGELGPTGEPYAQIFDASGRLVGWSRRLSPTPLISARTARTGSGAARTLSIPRFAGAPPGARVRLFRVRGPLTAAIYEPVAPQVADLARLRLLLALAMPAALLLASVGGYRVAGRALEPVEAMRRRAASIGAGDLSDRLPVPNTGDEIERLAVTLNELLERIEVGLERERRVLSDASHELRTPISVLRTRAEVALRGPDAELRTALEGIVADASRLSRLAEDLLVLARAEQGDLPLRNEPLEAWDLATSAVARAAATGLEVEIVDETAGGAVVLGDATRLGQALDNLLANAGLHGSPPVRLRLQQQGALTLFAVEDSGPGVPAEFLPRAFERFSQADPTGERPGSGLGLAIAGAIAAAHGGYTELRNLPAGGAAATLTLPSA